MSLRSGRTSASRRRIAAVATALAGLVLVSGCSLDLHPGVAATVETTSDQGETHETTIQQSDVDGIVSAACNYIVASNKASDGTSQIAISDLRSNILSTMVVFQVLDNATKDLGLTIYPADIDKVASQTTLPDGLSAADQATLTSYFESTAEATLQQATIEAHQKDSSVTTSTGVDPNSITGAQSFVKAQLDAATVSVNPAYGSWNGTSIDNVSGSLSGAVSPDSIVKTDPNGNTDVTDLPPSEVCG